MSWNIDFPWAWRLENTAPRAAVDIICGDREGHMDWWRQRLQEQGHELEQIERLIAQYREVAWRSGATASARGGS
jgi:hypothetical protein